MLKHLRKKTVFLLLPFYLVFYSQLNNAATIIYSNGFESGNLNTLRCSGNCPSITSSLKANGNYAADFSLNRNMRTPFRTEAYLDQRKGDLSFGEEYWIGFNYYRVDYAPELDGESNLQIYPTPGSWDSQCIPGSAWSSAPLFFATGNGKEHIVSRNRVLWEGPYEIHKWNSVVFHLYISKYSDGYVEAWKNGVFLGRLNGANSLRTDNCGNPMGDPFIIFGLYKWTWKYQNTSVSSRRMIFDNFKFARGANGYTQVSSNAPEPTSEPSTSTSLSISNVQANATETAATVTWDTNYGANSLVYYGTSTQYESRVTNDSYVTSHRMTLSNLKENTTYYYKVRSDRNGKTVYGPGLSFKTSATSSSNNQGYIAHWTMDYANNGIVPDVSGNGNNGLLNNGAKVASGGSIWFDGYNDYLDVGKFDLSGNQTTISGWIWIDDLSQCPYADCRIISKATSTSESAHYFMLSTVGVGSKVRLRVRLKTGGYTSTLVAGSGDIVRGRWTHVAATYDGRMLRLYKDGAEVGSMAKSGSISTNRYVPVWIGGSPDGSTSRPWRGHIDDVRIFNYALSRSEIANLSRE